MKGNILEEETVQECRNSIQNNGNALNDGNVKAVYSFMKQMESSIEEAIRRIDKYEEALKECLDGKPQVEKLSFGDFLMLGCDVKADGKILAGIEKQKFLRKRINDCFRAKRNWEDLLEELQKGFLPTISATLNLCETPKKVEITNQVIRTQEVEIYLDSLANQGLLNLQTMEVLCSLERFAVELKKILQRPLRKNDLIDFKRKGSGKPYSKRAIENAVAYANTGKKRETKKKEVVASSERKKTT